MKALLLLALLPACAAFDEPQPIVLHAPARLCVVGVCADLIPIERELQSPEMTARLCATGADSSACRK